MDEDEAIKRYYEERLKLLLGHSCTLLHSQLVSIEHGQSQSSRLLYFFKGEYFCSSYLLFFFYQGKHKIILSVQSTFEDFSCTHFYRSASSLLSLTSRRLFNNKHVQILHIIMSQAGDIPVQDDLEHITALSLPGTNDSDPSLSRNGAHESLLGAVSQPDPPIDQDKPPSPDWDQYTMQEGDPEASITDTLVSKDDSLNARDEVPNEAESSRSSTTPPIASKAKSKPERKGPQLIGHLPRAEEAALKTFVEIQDNHYQYGTLGRSREALESMTCECQYEHGRCFVLLQFLDSVLGTYYML